MAARRRRRARRFRRRRSVERDDSPAAGGRPAPVAAARPAGGGAAVTGATAAVAIGGAAPPGINRALAGFDLVRRLQTVGGDDRPLRHAVLVRDAAQRLPRPHDDALPTVARHRARRHRLGAISGAPPFWITGAAVCGSPPQAATQAAQPDDCRERAAAAAPLVCVSPFPLLARPPTGKKAVMRRQFKTDPLHALRRRIAFSTAAIRGSPHGRKRCRRTLARSLAMPALPAMTSRRIAANAANRAQRYSKTLRSAAAPGRWSGRDRSA